MAVILGVFDPNRDRREQVRRRLPASLSDLAHLSRKETPLHGLDLYWEAPPSTPISIASDQIGAQARSAFVVGDFAAPYSATSTAAQRLLQLNSRDVRDLRCVSGQDGYYLAVLVDDSPRIALGTDVLGEFPLYVWSKGDVLLFGTSPELFKSHPLFKAEPNPYGIASILLINHISGGQCLYKEVSRSTPGKYVDWTPNRGITEQTANPLQISDAGFGLSYPETKARVAACFNTFHEPLRILPKVSIFLSGGQDSRMVAGYMGRYLPRANVTAVSLGRSSDQELQYARKVSGVLGWRHRYEDVEFEQYPDLARRQLRLESLQGPFASFDTSTAQKLLADQAAPFLSGYIGDPVMGDAQIYHAFSSKTGLFSFDTLLDNIGQYGFRVPEIRELLSGQGGENAVEAVVSELKQAWDRIDGLPFQKAWMFRMTHRTRFHVGSIAWRLSLGAWHIQPYISRPLLELIASTPLGYLKDRRMQAEIIKSEFPRLAVLPLDRNTGRPDYLIRTPFRRFVEGLPTLADISWRLHRYVEQRHEKRYYFRTYDFNAPGWQSVRREAERYRAQAGTLLNPDALNRLLPPADSTPAIRDGIIDSSKTKTLVGLVLWNGLNAEPS